MKFRKTLCPHCGQSIKGTFAGVWFTPARFRVLKAIKETPGITLVRLGNKLYPDNLDPKSKAILQTITAINNLLAGTDYRIEGPGRRRTESGYRLTKKTWRVINEKKETWTSMWSRPFHRPELL